MKKNDNGFYLNSFDLDENLKSKYIKIKNDIENNQDYIEIINEILEKESKSDFYMKKLVEELNKNSKELYNIDYSLEFDEGYYINVFDFENETWEIIMEYSESNVWFYFFEKEI